MSIGLVVAAAALSWLCALLFECRFYLRVGALDRGTLREILPSLMATAFLQPAFVVGALLWLGNYQWAAEQQVWLCLGAAGWVWIDRLLRCSIVAALSLLGVLGKATILVADSRLLDFGPWASIRSHLSTRLAERLDALRETHGRHTDRLVRRHRRRIRRHIAFQRRFAWLFGGDWYSDVRPLDLDDPDRRQTPRGFAAIVQGIGIDDLPILHTPDARSFERCQPLRDRRVYVIPAADGTPTQPERAKVLDSGAHGLRVRTHGTSIDRTPVGGTVMVQTSRGRYRCAKRWQARGQAGLEILDRVE